MTKHDEDKRRSEAHGCHFGGSFIATRFSTASKINSTIKLIEKGNLRKSSTDCCVDVNDSIASLLDTHPCRTPKSTRTSRHLMPPTFLFSKFRCEFFHGGKEDGFHGSSSHHYTPPITYFGYSRHTSPARKKEMPKLWRPDCGHNTDLAEVQHFNNYDQEQHFFSMTRPAAHSHRREISAGPVSNGPQEKLAKKAVLNQRRECRRSDPYYYMMVAAGGLHGQITRLIVTSTISKNKGILAYI